MRASRQTQSRHSILPLASRWPWRSIRLFDRQLIGPESHGDAPPYPLGSSNFVARHSTCMANLVIGAPKELGIEAIQR